MIKKMMTIILVCSLMTVLAACGGKNAAPEDTSPVDTAPVETAPAETTPAETTPVEAAPALGSADAAYETYALVAGKLSADSGEEYDMDFAILMDMTYQDEAMSFSMDGNIKMKTVGDKAQFSMVMDMGALGGVTEMYSDGDTVYYTVNGIEQEIDIASAMEQVTNNVNLPEFEKEAITSAETEQTAEGLKTTIIIDGRKLSEFIADAMGSDLAALGEGGSMEISDIELEMVTDAAGNPKTMNMLMAMSITADAETIEIAASYEYIFNKLGSGVEIDLSALAA